MPTVTWHLSGREPFTEQVRGPISVTKKVFLKFQIGSQFHQKKIDHIQPIDDLRVQAHINPNESFVITFEDEVHLRKLLRDYQPRQLPEARHGAGGGAATSIVGIAQPKPVASPNTHQRLRARAAASDDDLARFSQNRLPKVGGYLHGASKSSQWTSGLHDDRLGHGAGGSSWAPAASNSAASPGGLRTPETNTGAKRPWDRTDPAVAEEDEAEAKRRLIDGHSYTATGTPEKLYRPHPQRAVPPQRGGLIFVNRPAQVQSSSVYRSYRTTETFGLRNLGNTCYLNAVMQAFCSLREFFADLKCMPATVSTCESGELYRCTVDILQQMSNPDNLRGPLNPARLRERVAVACPMFATNAQQDAHEFFLEYLNQLHDELLAARNRWLTDQGVTPDTADGEVGALATHVHLDSEVRKTLACEQCNTRRHLQERFHDFSLDFDSVGGDSCALTSMLQGYFASEEVEVKCDRCSGARASLEKQLEAPPRTLVLHLKRFVPNIVLQRYDKQHQRVEIPERLDLRSCVPLADGPMPAEKPPACSALSAAAPPAPSPVHDVPRPLHRRDSLEVVEPSGASTEALPPPPLPPPAGPPPEVLRSGPPLYYSLRSVVSHDGASPHSGHYVCYARGENGAWRLFDDSTVKQFGPEFDLTKLGRQAYILFYVLESPDAAKSG